LSAHRISLKKFLEPDFGPAPNVFPIPEEEILKLGPESTVHGPQSPDPTARGDAHPAVQLTTNQPN